MGDRRGAVAATAYRTLIHRFRPYRRRTATLLLLCVALAAPLRWLSAVEVPPPLAELFPAGEIRIAVDATYPPFASASDGALTGFDIDIGRTIGARLGLPVRFVNMGYDGLYDSLVTGQTDVILSALLVDRLRLADFTYSLSYFDAGLVLVSAAERPFDAMTALPGHSLAYEFGSSADNDVRRWSRRVDAFEKRPYELPEYALDAVRLRQADAALVDAVSAWLYLRSHAGWRAQVVSVTYAPIAAGVRIDRADIVKVINRELDAMIQDGTLDRLLRRWF